jgi:DNA-binding transcriptional LysR family regulator
MDLEHLKTYRAVARTGSFTAAADLLHYAQSTVSVHIRSLETEVGAPLFDRLPAGARLTEAGRRLMPLAERHGVPVAGADRAGAVAAGDQAARIEPGADLGDVVGWQQPLVVDLPLGDHEER